MSPRFKSQSIQYPTIPYQQCIAKTTENDKPGISVYDHCIVVGKVAKDLFNYISKQLSDEIPVDPGIVAAMHDVGKVSPGFQDKYFRAYIEKLCPEFATCPKEGLERNHARISEAAICQFLKAEFSDDFKASIGRIAGFHHGRHELAPLTDIGEVFGGECWSQERQKLISALETEFGRFHVSELPEWQLDFLTGLVCVADWIGSDESCFPVAGLPVDVNIADLAQKAVGSCGWQHLHFKPNLSFSDVFGFHPYPLQQQFIENVKGPGLYVLEAPMGLGKTEAALFAAYKVLSSGQASGVYFGLPTRLTSDKMHERVSEFLNGITEGTKSVRLAHGNAWLEEYGFNEINVEDRDKTTWYHPRKRALLYPFTVGTIDQALLGIIRVKHFFVRQFGLAGKVVILDEVHSYDQYTGTLLDKLVERLLELKCTVIILSATLTHSRRSRLMSMNDKTATPELAYPAITVQSNGKLVTSEPPPPPSRTVKIEFEDLKPEDVANAAIKRAEQGQCVLCIANTVAQAQQWHNHIQGNMKEDAFEVGLLHSKFLGWRRDELEKAWIGKLGKNGNRPQGCVLVATQIVEQSIDIDADAMITELAPSDMLLQRIGRLWRHNRSQRPVAEPEVMIITGPVNNAEDEEALIEAMGKVNTLVYSTYNLWRTYQVWSKYSLIRIPDDVRSLLEETYTEQSNEPEYIHKLKLKLDYDCEKLIQRAFSAQASVQGMPAMTDNENAPTRYCDRPMTDVLIVATIDSTDKAATLTVLNHLDPIKVHAFGRDVDTLKRLYTNILAIPTYQLSQSAIGTPLYLRKYFFDNTVVLVLGSDGQLTFDGRPTGFRYDSDRGLQRINTTSLPKHTTRLDVAEDLETYTYSDYDNQEDTFYESCNW